MTKDGGEFWCIIFSVFTSISFLAMIVNLFFIISTIPINDKISILNEENNKIETNINEIILKHQNYEKDTYESLKQANPSIVFNMYPELKNDELVKQQINIYVENNNDIKKLKLELADSAQHKFNLYFGK